MIENAYKDSFSVHFDDQTEAEQFFSEQYMTDRWITPKTTNMTVAMIDETPVPLNWTNPSYAEGKRTRLDLKDCDVEAIMDTMDESAEGTQLYMKIPGHGNHLVRNVALDGIKYRSGQEGRVTDIMYKKRRADYYPVQINRGMEIMDAEVKVLIRGQKVSAINSEQYAILPYTELISELTEELETRFKGYFFTGGDYDHHGMSMAYMLPEQTEELLGKYREALVKANSAAASAATFMPSIILTSSDIGMNSATVRARITCSTVSGKSFEIEIGDAVKLAHKGGATAAKFRENCAMLFAAYQNQAEKLAELLNVRIKTPENCIKALCSRYVLPIGILRYALDGYACRSADGTHNAHDVFWAVCEAMGTYLTEKELVGYQRIRIEECAARMLLIPQAEWRELELKVKEGK